MDELLKVVQDKAQAVEAGLSDLSNAISALVAEVRQQHHDAERKLNSARIAEKEAAPVKADNAKLRGEVIALRGRIAELSSHARVKEHVADELKRAEAEATAAAQRVLDLREEAARATDA